MLFTDDVVQVKENTKVLKDKFFLTALIRGKDFHITASKVGSKKGKFERWWDVLDKN